MAQDSVRAVHQSAGSLQTYRSERLTKQAVLCLLLKFKKRRSHAPIRGPAEHAIGQLCAFRNPPQERPGARENTHPESAAPPAHEARQTCD